MLSLKLRTEDRKKEDRIWKFCFSSFFLKRKLRIYRTRERGFLCLFPFLSHVEIQETESYEFQKTGFYAFVSLVFSIFDMFQKFQETVF